MSPSQSITNFPKETKAHISKGLVLIVDDTPNNIQVLSEALIQQGYEVRGAVITAP